MRILIVNPFGIGDVLFSTPLISNLKEALPQSYIGYICNIRAKDVLCGNPQINEIFVFEKDEYRSLWKRAPLKCIRKFISFLMQIKKEKFDLVIDLSLGHQYGFFLWLVGVRKRIGYNYRNRGRFLTHKINITGYEDKPIADYYLDLLNFLDIHPRRCNLTMKVSATDKAWADEFFKKNGLKEQDLIVGLIPAGGASWGKDFSYRHWPWENYAELADKLIAKLKAKVVIFGSPSEKNICQQVEDAINTEPINVCGKTTLKQFAACLAKCNLVICNDGGPLHVAVSQDVTTVAIFGPVDEKVYGPYPPGSEHIVLTENIECRPCYKKFRFVYCEHRSCLKNVTPNDVFYAIKNKLEETRK